MAINFRYKFFKGQPAPIITIGLKIKSEWYPIEVYVDSGSNYTVFHAQIAEAAGLDYLSGKQIYLQVGDGSFIPVYLHTLEIQLREVRFRASVGFSEKLGIGFNLLGRVDVFDKFKICFSESQGVISFEPVKVRRIRRSMPKN